MESSVILTEIEPGLFEIRFDRAERMNALSVAMVNELKHAVDEVTRRSGRVLLIRGSGRAFCAGADLKERKGMDLEARMAHNAGIREALLAIENARFVTIAVLNGTALGGGLELALACDLRIASTGVSVGLTESRVGAFPGAGGTQRLPRIVGRSRALHMMLLGEPVTSEYALSIGLVNELTAPEELDARAREMGALLLTRSAPALAEIKRLVAQGMEMPLDDALMLETAALPAILASADYAEGLAAFEQKRAPRFVEPA
ncbi:enoyl-CoA hydratase-related protein [Caballeronia sp. LZ035]|uniref:enoyl-CoA hydratase/isomerase family protein n=1 Tax=Caballeronia sp. LZ035 TaxID=3038568 RepID=UPI00285EBA40|nr:enoyl-CoA hydratase-related protein [Caballeronia sp. LZ035]MDR5760559.1 enoyl-CoA hydratase-related protein [Caballeronia sp. LZ035]